MGLGDLTDPAAVMQAMDEFDRLGREAFLAKYRFGGARRYFVVRGSQRYDSKAIVGAAHGYQHGVPLKSTNFSGGDASVVPVLARMGFRVTDGGATEPLSGLIEDVLLLQTEWDHRKTDAMDQRGRIVRTSIPDWLRNHFDRLMPAVSWPEGDLTAEGRDGTGPKTEIPWTRLYSESRSPSATTGWYVVFLFSALGDRCYLTLMHGATEWDGVEFRPRPRDEMQRSLQWARGVLGARLNEPRLQAQMTLDARRSPLGPSYEAGTVAAVEYLLDDMPTDDEVLTDLTVMLTMLSLLYATEDSDPRAPGVAAPEVRLVADAVDAAVGKRGRRGGQGFGLNKVEQRAVERRAVELATQHFKSEGWIVKDVGDRESYDLRCTRGEERLWVEVKGTTSLGETVLLTKNEVQLHRDQHPRNALAVVHSIVLNPRGEAPIAHGGTLEVTRPWDVLDDDLTPIAYTYRRRGGDGVVGH